jgi:hypothetical protein
MTSEGADAAIRDAAIGELTRIYEKLSSPATTTFLDISA